MLGPFRLTRSLLGALAATARERGSAVVLNVSSDAAVNAYATWGAYGASKAALAHLTRIWNEEMIGEGVRFLNVDPGDMDTSLHALAVPDADRSTLKRPEEAAREMADVIAGALFERRAVESSASDMRLGPGLRRDDETHIRRDDEMGPRRDDEDALHVEDRSTHSGAAAADVTGRSAVAATETTGARWSWAAATATAEAASTAVPACTRTRAASAKAAAGTVVVAATATAADTATAIRTAGTEVTAAAARDI